MKISTWRLITYSLPSAPTSILMMMLVVYLAPFYAAELGLDLAKIGFIFFLARLWDAVIDPLVGNLSDLSKTRFGRRKPWIICGLPLLMLSTFFLLQPPPTVTISYLAIAVVVFYLAITVVQIPYLSWGVELSRDYIERIRVNGFREAGTMAGILLVAGIPLIFFMGKEPTIAELVEIIAYVVLVLLPLTFIPALIWVPKGTQIIAPKRTLFKAIYTLRNNRPFLRLMLASIFIWTGGHIYNSLSLFLVKDALGFSPAIFLKLLAIQYTCALLMMPLVMKAGKRFGKHYALLFIGMAFFPTLWLFLLAAPQNLTHLYLISAAKGAVTSAIWIMPPALVADSIEHGLLEGSGDDTGLYMSIYFFIQKLAAASAVGIALPLASALGFDPALVSDTYSYEGLKFVAVILPSIIALPAIFLLFNYPLTKDRHDSIRLELEKRGLKIN
ncbi:MAG: MFS transporter [Halieaceae bacterium]|nr:MFS transporter [Halieaceae bacterium]